MLFDVLFKDKRHRADLVAQAETKERFLLDHRASLDHMRLLKLKRQVELWSILNLDSDSEEEYFSISRTIADLVKEIGAIDEYTDDMKSARLKCKDKKQCDILEHLLQIEDPWAEKIKKGTQDAIPRFVPAQPIQFSV